MRSAVLLVLLGLLGGCATRQVCETCAEPAAGAPAEVTVVGGSVEAIRDAFNARAERARVVLLVSPTCSECVYGGKAVRQEIVDRFSQSGVAAIVVWEPMLKPDTEESARGSSALFGGTDAVQFYDPERHAGWAYQRGPFSRSWDEVDGALPADHWLRRTGERTAGPQWDLYMLYRPGVRWEGGPPRPDAFIRHLGRDHGGRSWYFRDRFDREPMHGDLFVAMRAMGGDVLGEKGAARGPAPRIELLGFPGCPNTPAMREGLRSALAPAGLTFDDVNQEGLPRSDPRRGWPTPTVLINGADLFGMEAPSTPAPGCRIYPGGTPSAAQITDRLRALRVGRF